MKGQWLGKYEGTNSGNMMLNIDEVDSCFEGVAYLIPVNTDLPGTVAYFQTKTQDLKQSAEVSTFPIDQRNGFQTTWNKIQELFPDATHSDTAKATFEVDGDNFRLSASSNVGVDVRANLSRSPVDSKTKIAGEEMSWSQFKECVATLSKDGYLFRGQREPWPLCTSFHRRGRYRISEFTSKDVRQLHQRLSAITKHLFDLNIPEQNGAFFNLLQHHGYPTPLLDWSHSPFVAAFFAFRDRPIGTKDEGRVRIYLFNNRKWTQKYPQVQNLDPCFPHLSVMEFISIDNPRALPQQAVTTVTNIHDIESYLLQKHKESGIDFIRAIDIPASERESPMADLQFMGITAGSMFPSIDGVCEELKERNFKH
jgi:hypothetical protein